MAEEAKKGKKGGNCNRTACQQPGAIYYNRYTDAYYCRQCAQTLNEVNGIKLCVLEEEEQA